MKLNCEMAIGPNSRGHIINQINFISISHLLYFFLGDMASVENWTEGNFSFHFRLSPMRNLNYLALMVCT